MGTLQKTFDSVKLALLSLESLAYLYYCTNLII